jgi:CopG family nickel-responsive transcriptional regulator
MADLNRIGVAIEADLLKEFDRLIEQRGYPSRSEAFRDLIRDALVEESAASGSRAVVGTITLVYDHHVRQLGDRLTALQHEFHHSVLSTLHVHLDHDHCLEVIVVRGKGSQVKRMADALISMKGVKHGRLTVTVGPGRHAEPA